LDRDARSWLGETDPTIGVKKFKHRSEGHHTWTEEEIQQYYKRHPLGTKPRLALDLLRYTTGRREDAPRPGRQHIRDGKGRNFETVRKTTSDKPCHSHQPQSEVQTALPEPTTDGYQGPNFSHRSRAK
jgi:hypothetical protein